MGFVDTIKNIWNKHKILIIIVFIVVIVSAVVGVTVGIVKNKKEGFEQLSNDNTVEINGHIIDCKPELDYMEEFLKTSKGLS